MNIMKLVESYSKGEVSNNQILQFVKWLQKDRDNIKTFIKEGNDYRNLGKFLAFEDLPFEKKDEGKSLFKTIEKRKKHIGELSFEGLRHIIGGSVVFHNLFKKKHL